MKKTADVVVIGAGINGCSIAYHLAKAGVKNVVLLEKKFPAWGPTGRSSGVVRQHYTIETLAQMARDSLRVFQHFEEEIGASAGFVPCGVVFIVPEADAASLRKTVEMHQRLGIKASVLSPQQLLELDPHLCPDGIACGAYEPEGGYPDLSQPQHAQRAEADVVRENARAVRGQPVPPSQEVASAHRDMMIDRAIRQQPGPVVEVARPALQNAVQPDAHFRTTSPCGQLPAPLSPSAAIAPRSSSTGWRPETSGHPSVSAAPRTCSPESRTSPAGAHVGGFPVGATFPVSQAGRRPRLHSRGLLELHSRYGLQGCSANRSGFGHKVPAWPVTEPGRLPATRFTESYLGGTCTTGDLRRWDALRNPG